VVLDKYRNLKALINRYPSAVVAFSGGVDSTFLASVAGEVLGDKALLITASSSTYPASEQADAVTLANKLGLRHRIIVSEETEIEGFADNPPDRCYYCKRELFSKLTTIAKEEGFAVVFDGSNADDLRDYRPGRMAVAELCVVSPLCETGLTKEEIRTLSRERGLPTAEKPSFACLASRFPYGEKITRDKLDRVGRVEEMMKRLGFRQFRVRSHQDLARIEVAPEEMERAWQMRKAVGEAGKSAGFVFVAIDVQGYRTGAMNEVLPVAK
jgi:pyridinium-3,5-biscarboxylic acid mononucleotide sulfurtransferase